MPAKERLTASQFKFVKAYASHREPQRAYREAFGARDWADSSVAAEASKLLALPKIALKIEQEIAELESLTGFTAAAALHAFLNIATADPRELIELRVGACRYCYGIDGAYQWDDASYLKALRDQEKLSEKDRELPDITGGFGYDPRREPNPACVPCAGNGVQRVVPKDTANLSPQALMLYGGVKQTRNGIEIIVADRMKALENAARIIGAFKDSVRLDGTIGQMVDIMQMTDPNEAAKAYQELMRRRSVNGRGSLPAPA
jgi:phage terminase small subunit